MKKLFVILAILMLAFALSSCSLIFASYEEDLEYDSKRSSETYTYLAVNVNVLALVTQDEQGDTEIMYQIELVVDDRFVSSHTVREIINDIQADLSLQTSYLTTYYIDNGTNLYSCHCYLVNGYSGDIEHTGSNYGFFYINHDYDFTAPSWINSLREVTYNSAKQYLDTETRKVDSRAVRLRYYLVADAPLVSDGAIEIYKNIYDGETQQYYQSLKWDAGEDYDFTSIKLVQRSMASGWYIFAILIGVATVVIILFVVKDKKPQECNYQDVNVEATTATPFDELNNNKQEVQQGQNLHVENQISMEDFIGRAVNGSEDKDGR